MKTVDCHKAHWLSLCCLYWVKRTLYQQRKRPVRVVPPSAAAPAAADSEISVHEQMSITNEQASLH